jgi:hypothetical protein
MKKQFYLDESDKFKNIFETPKDYFEDFPQRMSKRMEKSKSKSIGVWSLSPKYALVIASIVVLLVVGGIFFLLSTTQKTSEIGLSVQEINEYLLKDNIQEYELVDFYLEADLIEEAEENGLEQEILEEEMDIEEIEELL